MISRRGPINVALVILAACLVAHPALAQAPTVPPGPQSNTGFLSGVDAFSLFNDIGDAYSSLLLNQVFGNLFPSPDGVDRGTVLPGVVGFFNLVILVVGGGMFFWNVTVGTLQSAHEGQVLGARWSSLWAPIRLIFAVGLLVPVNDGYNLGQSGVAWVVQGGTRLASMVWGEAARIVLVDDVPVVEPSVSFPHEVTRQLWDQAVCATIEDAKHRTASHGTRSVAWSPYEQSGDPVIVQGITTGIDLHGMKGWTTRSHVRETGSTRKRKMDICGTRSTPETPEYLLNIHNRNVHGADATPQTMAFAERINTEFHAHHGFLLETLFRELKAVTDGLHDRIRDGDLGDTTVALARTGIADAHSTASTYFKTDIVDHVRAEATQPGSGVSTARELLLTRITGGNACGTVINGQVTGMDETCRGEGWMMAGAWYVLLARLNNEAISLSEAVGSSTPPENDIDVSRKNEEWRSRLRSTSRSDEGQPSHKHQAEIETGRYNLVYDEAVLGLAAQGFEVPNDLLTRINQESRGADDSFFSKLVEGVMVEWADTVLQIMDPANRHDPMIGIMWWGQTLMGAAAALMGFTLAVGTQVFGTGPGAGPAIFMLPIFSLLVAAGAGMAFILPLLPFFYWILALMGYFLLICEAIIAVSLWALSHLRMDGEGISGEAGRQGWIIILALFMTPVLMVIGFLLGMILFRVMANLIDIGMLPVVSAIIGANPIIFIFGMIAYSIVMVTAYVLLLERSFSLISEFPSRVLRWMGGSAEIAGGEGRVQAAAAAGVAGLNMAGNRIEGGVKSLIERRAGNRGQGGSVSRSDRT
ncbi:MAG: DotA/TraY family protein [Boseongicola sp. SB0677_bin_26]|nr:DotA/TraY family protein [Boseongicola sp. SB0665_bin_10]MYG25035.1 DotA/TraY family protein [Boseongicola sp. SB0677_bin_26]